MKHGWVDDAGPQRRAGLVGRQCRNEGHKRVDSSIAGVRTSKVAREVGPGGLWVSPLDLRGNWRVDVVDKWVNFWVDLVERWVDLLVDVVDPCVGLGVDVVDKWVELCVDNVDPRIVDTMVVSKLASLTHQKGFTGTPTFEAVAISAKVAWLMAAL